MEQERTKLAVELFDAHSEVYAKKFMDVSAYHASLDSFCEALPSGAVDVLELACGPGNITKYVLDKRPELRILATDLAPKMLKLAQVNNPGASFQLLDCREILSLGRSFDGIIGGFCLPYLDQDQARTMIRDAAKALRRNGVLYLSTMEGDPSQSGWKTSSNDPGYQLFMNYHTADFLTGLLSECGFILVDLLRTQTTATDGTVYNDLLLTAKLS
ncbi:MAG: class I SAM-dependent methyltransferase [Flavobacteriales bacterium]